MPPRHQDIGLGLLDEQSGPLSEVQDPPGAPLHASTGWLRHLSMSATWIMPASADI